MKRYEEAVKTYGEDFDDEHYFVIPEGCHWNDVGEKAFNVGTALQNAMRGIEVRTSNICSSKIKSML